MKNGAYCNANDRNRGDQSEETTTALGLYAHLCITAHNRHVNNLRQRQVAFEPTAKSGELEQGLEQPDWRGVAAIGLECQQFFNYAKCFAANSAGIPNSGWPPASDSGWQSNCRHDGQ